VNELEHHGSETALARRRRYALGRLRSRRGGGTGAAMNYPNGRSATYPQVSLMVSKLTVTTPFALSAKCWTS
jgi:hypothetical protein